MTNNEKYLSTSQSASRLTLSDHESTHRKNVWVVGSDQFRFTSSVVVTFVHVMHSETTCPASSDQTNRFVHRLTNRLHTLA